jgi:predicted transcriptional regulator
VDVETKRIQVRVSDELLRRFDVFATRSGSPRTVAIRLLIAKAVQRPLLASINTKSPRHTQQIGLRLTRREEAALVKSAALMGLSRSGWVAGLVRRHISNAPTFSRPDQLSLSEIQGELRRIATKLIHIGQSADLAVSQGGHLELDSQYFENLRREVRGHILALRKALEGNLAYWDVGDD